MAAVAVGIIRDIARYCEQSEKMEATLPTPVEEERVQIAVSFLP